MKIGDAFAKIGTFVLYAGLVGFIVFAVYSDSTHEKRCMKVMETVSPDASDEDYFDALADAFARLTYGENTLEISRQTKGKYVLQVDDIRFPAGPLEAGGDVAVGAKQDSVRLHGQLVRMCQA